MPDIWSVIQRIRQLSYGMWGSFLLKKVWLHQGLPSHNRTGTTAGSRSLREVCVCAYLSDPFVWTDTRGKWAFKGREPDHWYHRISTLDMFSLLNFTAMYWILGCVALMSTDFHQGQVQFLTMFENLLLGSALEFNKLFLGPLYTLPQSFTEIRSVGFVQSGRQTNHTKNMTFLVEIWYKFWSRFLAQSYCLQANIIKHEIIICHNLGWDQ